MKKTILLIRHAQSANNSLPECERVPDPGLTELGHQQAQRLADALSKFPVSQIYCSPFRRSLDTALPASEMLNIKPSINAHIYEQGGCYSGFEPGQVRGEPGMNRAQLQDAYPGWHIDDSIGPGGWNVNREYESDSECQQRAGRVASWLTKQWSPTSSDHMAAFVIHADFKRVLIGELLETDRWPDHWQPLWNTGLSQLVFDGSQWQLLKWNLVSHLSPELRTPSEAGISAA